jgi:hypothetical protein
MKIIILTMSLVIAEYPSPLSVLVGWAVPTETLTHIVGSDSQFEDVQILSLRRSTAG